MCRESDGGEDSVAYGWLRDMVDLLERGDSAEEVLENSRLAMYQDQVFCFTPKGDLISLPRGATPIDFAYAVHTDLGNTAVGAKVNGDHVPLHTPLQQWRPGGDHHAPRIRRRRRCGSSSWSPAGRGPKSAASCAMPSATSMCASAARSWKRPSPTRARELTDKAIERSGQEAAPGQGRGCLCRCRPRRAARP